VKNGIRRILITVFCAFALLMPASAFGEVFYIEDTGFVVEPPVGWQVLDLSDSKWTFTDFTGNAFLQIKVWPGSEYGSIDELYDGIMQKIQAAGEGDIFDYYGREAAFGVVDFSTGGFDYSGYGLFVDGEDFDLTVLSFTTADSFDVLRDYILSALDSFALSPVMMLNPGPVSRYYLESFGSPVKQSAETVFEDVPLKWSVDKNEIEASQLLIERESAILADYKVNTDAGTEAWKRYYRMIYRDNFSRLDYPAAILKERIIKSSGKNADDDAAEPGSSSWLPFGSSIENRRSRNESVQSAPLKLLEWVQGFTYVRTGGSDLVSPLTAAAFQEGDCDSRALLYIILLNHYGIDSALMVSSAYSHAMAAVDTEGVGARIDVNGKMFLVAETTDDVGIGMIAADMADPANWIVIPLMEKEPWN